MKNKKLLIITCNDLNNYGNRFQNIALSIFLKSYNLSVKTLWPNRYFNNFFEIIKYLIRKIQYQYFYVLNPFSKKGKRIRSFISFNKMFIKVDRSMFKISKCNKLIDNNYDYVLVGSDQVLNKAFGPNPNITSLSYFKGIKKISYAMSLGAQKEFDESQTMIIKNLNHFDSLSVREPSTMCEVKKYISSNKAISVNIDPVFLIDKNYWNFISETKISKKIRKIAKDNYLFVYWIGDQDSETINQISEFASHNNLRVITIRSNSKQKELNTITNCSPFEFLYLLKNCKYSVVKSFHGLAMSIVFQKPFWIYDEYYRADNTKHDPRFINLISTLGISNDVFELKQKKIDWELVSNNIKAEKQKASNYFANVALKDA